MPVGLVAVVVDDDDELLELDDVGLVWVVGVVKFVTVAELVEEVLDELLE